MTGEPVPAEVSESVKTAWDAWAPRTPQPVPPGRLRRVKMLHRVAGHNPRRLMPRTGVVSGVSSRTTGILGHRRPDQPGPRDARKPGPGQTENTRHFTSARTAIAAGMELTDPAGMKDIASWPMPCSISPPIKGAAA